MAEDRFANVFNATLDMTAANAVSFAQLNFGVSLRDRIGIVIDQLFWFPGAATLGEMTTNLDRIIMAITLSDQITSIADLSDNRIIFVEELQRLDFGTAAAATVIKKPIVSEFAPPIIVLPTRMFLAMDSVGLASAGHVDLRMHYRTVSISAETQLREVLETFQLST